MKRTLSFLLNVNINLIFSQIRIRNFTKNNLKYKDSPLDTSGIVYKYTCICDKNQVYIGESSLKLRARIESHISQGIQSAICSHTEQCSIFKNKYSEYCLENNLERSSKKVLTSFMCLRFNILKRCNSNNNRRWHEALKIKQLKPQMNKKDEILPFVHF